MSTALGRPPRVAIVGSTATGKSDVAMEVARRLGDVELISVDSMQVYRGMDIGTAKPTPAERAEVRHHCLDLVDVCDDFAVAEFKVAHDSALADVAHRANRAILVGGTGLYHRVVVDDFDLPGEFPEARASLEILDTPELFAMLSEQDPTAAAKIDPANRRRVLRAMEVTVGSGRRFSSFGPGVDHYPIDVIAQIGLRRPRPEIAARIEVRVRRMIEEGLVDEVAGLAEQGMSRTAAQAIGYKEILLHLEGAISREEAIAMVITRTRQFAVRQERWFRRDPRIRWIDIDQDPVTDVAPAVIRLLAESI